MRQSMVVRGRLLVLGLVVALLAISVVSSVRVFGAPAPAPLAHHALYPLPDGDWSVNANGFTGVLHIQGLDAAGHLVAGSTFFGDTIEGFYDRPSQRLQFMRIDTAGRPSTTQVYEGFLYHRPLQPVQGQRIIYYLAGSFTAFRGTGAIPTRGEYGWYASRAETCCRTATAEATE